MNFMKILDRIKRILTKPKKQLGPKISRLKIYHIHCSICQMSLQDNDIIIEHNGLIDHAICRGYDISVLEKIM